MKEPCYTKTLYPTFLIISQIIELLKHLPNVANKSNYDKW